MIRQPILALSFAILATTAAIGQSPPSPFAEGTQAFRTILRSQGLAPLRSPHDLRSNAGQKILIVFGTPTIVDELCRDGTLSHFLANGGAFLLATDRRTPESVFDRFGIRVTGTIVTAPPRFSWRGMPHCPFVFPAGRADGPRTALFENLKTPAQVATNNPSFLDGNLEQTAAYLQIRLFSGGAGWPSPRYPPSGGANAHS